MPQITITTKPSDHPQRRHQAQFLADDRKNKIGVMLRARSRVLPAIAKPEPGPAAGAEREHGLIGLIPCSVLFPPGTARLRCASSASDRV